MSALPRTFIASGADGAAPQPYAPHIPDIADLPASLVNEPIWCAWKLIKKQGKKPDKVPVSANPETLGSKSWGNLAFGTNAAEAIGYAAGVGLHGVGIILRDGCGLAGGDIDNCINLETGEIDAEAARIIEEADTYTETSPSLAGFRFIARGTFGGHTGNNGRKGIEMYEDGRFLTITGRHYPGTPKDAQARDLSELGRRYFERKQTELPAPPHEAWVDGSAPGEGGYTLAEVLPFLRNNGVDYDEWQKVGAAIKTAGGTYDDWLSYSRQCAEKHDETDMPKKWASFKDKSKGAGMGTLARMAMANGMKSRKEQRQKNTPLPPKTPIASVFTLPDYPAELADLPHKLGQLQAFIANRMTYPSMHMAGITALATLTAFAQKNIIINSRDGLGFNEYYMILAPTGFGKEDIRKPLEILDLRADDAMTPEIVAEAGGGNLSGIDKTAIRHAAPASAQGAHELLEENRSIFYLSDEFAEWLRGSHRDGKRQEALGYLMQAYTRATGTIEPGNAVTNKYKPVKNPRLSVMATSTAAAMFETLSREQADSGAYNRWVIHAGDEELPQKRYTGLVYEPAQPLVDFIAWVKAIPPNTRMKFSGEAFEAFVALDSELAEPIKRKDGILGGRLAEQSIKMAGLIALAARRLTIEPGDLQTAFNIRVGLYHRASALARHEGSLEGLHATGKALEQVAEVFRRAPSLYRSQLPALSRRYKSLSLPERNAVVEALMAEGIAEKHVTKYAVLLSLVYEGE